MLCSDFENAMLRQRVMDLGRDGAVLLCAEKEFYVLPIP